MAPEDDKKKLLSLLTPVLLKQPTVTPFIIDLNSIAMASISSFQSQTHVTTLKAFQEHTKLERARDRLLRNPRPEQGGKRITEDFLLSLSQRECLYQFRFLAEELVDLVQVMHIPETIKTRSGYVFSGLEALGLLCARFRTAADMYDLTAKYDRCQSSISEGINELVSILDKRWQHLLSFDKRHALHPDALASYAKAIHKAGAPIDSIWGFIDCTIRKICRPSEYQRIAYSGYKKHHALKFQAVVLPNGLFGHLYGPIEGRRADTGLLNDSKLLQTCLDHTFIELEGENERRYFQLYGDAAYGLSRVIMSPYAGSGPLSEDQIEWNRLMGSVRIDVEHAFGNVSRTWQFLNAGWKMQIFRSPVGCYYRVGVLLTNALNCLRPNQVSQAFDLAPPELEDYFHD